LGYSAIVKRQLGGPPSSLYLENIPRLPIKMFINRSLRGALREESHMRGNLGLDLEGSWPDRNAPSDRLLFMNQLASFLWDASQGFSGTSRDPPDQICHFSCHCDTLTNSLASNYTLWLQSGEILNMGRQAVTLGSLTDELVQLGIGNQGDRRARPLIFLNACGSGDMDPAGASSFPALFLNKGLGFIGFIGTETTIADDFASAFSESFYENLLLGTPLGRAIHVSRWQLLRSRRNPLGILYTMYAEPETRVRRPVQKPTISAPRMPTKTTNGVLPFLRRVLGRSQASIAA
jgi:hypothetical protein